MKIPKITVRNWQLILNFLIVHLPILVRCKTKGAVGAVQCAPSVPLAIRCLIANYCTRGRCNFKGLSRDGGWADFSKNLRASLFNDDLLNDPNFGWTVPLILFSRPQIHKYWFITSLTTVSGHEVGDVHN